MEISIVEGKRALDELIAARQNLKIAQLVAQQDERISGFYDPVEDFIISNQDYRRIVFDDAGNVVSDCRIAPPLRIETSNITLLFGSRHQD